MSEFKFQAKGTEIVKDGVPFEDDGILFQPASELPVVVVDEDTFDTISGIKEPENGGQ